LLYLGHIAGEGMMTCDGVAVGRVAFDFEGYSRPGGQIMSSGEIEAAPADLQAAFGRPRVQLLTDAGQLLDLKFSEKVLNLKGGVALVEVSGDLPKSREHWRG
jgi:hypothetical protein